MSEHYQGGSLIRMLWQNKQKNATELFVMFIAIYDRCRYVLHRLLFLLGSNTSGKRTTIRTLTHN